MGKSHRFVLGTRLEFGPDRLCAGYREARSVTDGMLIKSRRNARVSTPDPTRPLRSAIPGQVLLYIGAPERIRTPNPQIRSLVLYPVELRARKAAKLAASPLQRKVNYGGLPCRTTHRLKSTPS
jgi:hypothetical protein